MSRNVKEEALPSHNPSSAGASAGLCILVLSSQHLPGPPVQGARGGCLRQPDTVPQPGQLPLELGWLCWQGPLAAGSRLPRTSDSASPAGLGHRGLRRAGTTTQCWMGSWQRGGDMASRIRWKI